MTMAVSSKHSLETLEGWVTHKFGAVVNKNVVLPDLGNPHPFPKENLGKLVKLIPIKDKDYLSMIWTFPNFERDVEHHPLQYFA